MLAGFVAGDCGERPAAYCIIDLVKSRKERGPDRKMRREIKAKLLALTLALSMALGGAAIPGVIWADDTSGSSNAHYIAVASDRHNSTEAIWMAMRNMPESVEYVCLNGDMSNMARSKPDSTQSGDTQPPAQGGGSEGRVMKQMPYDTSTVLQEVRRVFPRLNYTNVSIIYGGHDANATDDAEIMRCADPGMLPSATEADAAEISAGESGLIYTGYDGNEPAYYVYGVSYYDVMKTGKAADSDEYGEGGRTSAEAFRKFADEHPDVPIIAIGHVPLHAQRNDNLAASFWNEALNYAATGSEGGTEIIRDVVYLCGHNHTSEKDESGRPEEYMIDAGGTLTVQGTEKDVSESSTIYYSYITAGYLRDNHTATLVTAEDGHLSFEKYTGWNVKAISFTPASDTIGMSSVYKEDNDGVAALDLSLRYQKKILDHVTNNCFFNEGDKCTVTYTDGSSKEFTFEKDINPQFGLFKAADGEEIKLEALPTNLSKEIRESEEGSADDLAAVIGENELGIEYMDDDNFDSDRGYADRVTCSCRITITEDMEHDCTAALRGRAGNAASCELNGMAQECYFCQVCGKYYRDAEAASGISKEEVFIPKLGHEWNTEYTIDTDSSCTEEGRRTIYCSRCGDAKPGTTGPVPLKDHQWNEELTVEQPATCTEEGRGSIHCSVCGAVRDGSETTIPAGHSFGEWTDVKAPTELAGGLRQRSCAVCGFTESEETAALAPSLKAVKILKPKPGKISATVRWKKISKKDRKRIKKVEIQCSTDRTFTENVKTSMASAGKVSKKIKGLHKGKVYYVRVRARNGDHISAWSKVKKVKPR